MHFVPTVIASAHSRYSGDIKVIEGLGFRHLSTDSIQHSGGIVTEIWSTALKKLAKNHKSWLVLGVAGGSVIQLISKKYQPSQIIGVDIDPVIVDLGYKYFGLDKIQKLKLLIHDAYKYCLNTRRHYDYVLVDLFGRDSCPSFVYTPKFLNKLISMGSHVLINHLYHTPRSQSAYQKLIYNLDKLHIPYYSHAILRNRVLILQ